MTASLIQGTPVEVVNRFDRRWARGFEIADAVDGGYRVRRISDHTVLPVVFPPSAVRADTMAVAAL